MKRRLLVFAGCLLLLVGAGSASAKTLDAVKLTAKPGGIKTKISALSNKKGMIFVAIATKKEGKFVERDRDRARGVKVGDGKVTIDAGQGGESYSKNGGEGLLSVGEEFAGYFRWNSKQKRIFFYN